MTDQQRRLWILACIGVGLLALAAGLAFLFHLRRYASHPWAVPAYPVSEGTPTTQFISDILGEATKHDRPKLGISTLLGTLYSRDGQATQLYVLEGKLNGAQIDPPGAWSHLQRSLLLVNSVDRYKAGGGGIGANVAIGCGVGRVDALKALTEGTEEVDPCLGPYKQEAHILWVADMAIYTTGRYRKIYKCSKEAYKDSKCIRQAIDSGFHELFVDHLPYKIEHHGLSGVIIPAIGTSLKDPLLEKEDFYETLTDQIYSDLTTDVKLPKAIYLQVYSGDRTPWSQTADAIDVTISNLFDKWNETSEHYTEAEPAAVPVIGVLGGLGLLLLSVACIPPLRAFRDLKLLLSGPIATTVLGWSVGSFGIAAVSHTFLSSWIWWDIGVCVIIGFFCGPLLRMSHLFDSPATR